MKFIVLSTQRSGSNLLRNYLNSHPTLNCEDELAYNVEAATCALRNKFDSLRSIELDQEYLTKRGIKRYHVNYNAHYPLEYYSCLEENRGFVIHYNQLDPNIDLEEFNIIHLVRNNLFERAFSVYEILNGLRDNENKFSRTKKVKVNKRKLNRIIRDSERDLSFWKDRLSGIAHLQVNYEKLFDVNNIEGMGTSAKRYITMPKHTADEICEFLKVDSADLYSASKRRNTPNYGKYISNWEKIKSLDIY